MNLIGLKQILMEKLFQLPFQKLSWANETIYIPSSFRGKKQSHKATLVMQA